MQTMQVLHGRMLIAKKEKVLVLGQVQLYGEGSSLHGVAIKVNLTQLLQVKQYSISSCLLHGFGLISAFRTFRTNFSFYCVSFEKLLSLTSIFGLYSLKPVRISCPFDLSCQKNDNPVIESPSYFHCRWKFHPW